MKTMLRFVIVAAVLGATGYYVYGHWIATSAGQVTDMDDRYSRLHRGMDEGEALRLMGSDIAPPQDWPGDARAELRYCAWWDKQYQGARQSKQIARAVRYTVPTATSQVTYELTFDQDGALVGRHRD